MTTAVLIPDGVGVRNFVVGRFLQEASRREDVHVFHAIPDSLLDAFRAKSGSRVHWHRLTRFRETPATFFLRNSLLYAQMYWSDTVGMRYRRRLRPTGPWKQRWARRLARGVGRLAASPGRLDLLDRWHQSAVRRFPEVEEYRRIFREVKPSVLFCSHQRPLDVLPPVLAAKSLGIPTATFIFSWDNLTTKGRIVAPFDHFLVWSRHMADELLRYYPTVDPKAIHVVGTPQFEPYADESIVWRREEFFRRIGANPARPLICYSGADSDAGPEDPEHVRALMGLVRSGVVRGEPQVLVRPSPVDDGKRYAKVLADFPELLFARPAWVHEKGGDWSHVVPLPEDVPFLANLARHADLNINLASTMTLDFALHDKAVVNVAFDIATPPPFGVPIWEHYYRFDHYRPVVELGAARFARSPEELASHVNAYLENPALDREARRRLVELEVGVPPGRSSSKVVEVLGSIARGSS